MWSKVSFHYKQNEYFLLNKEENRKISDNNLPENNKVINKALITYFSANLGMFQMNRKIRKHGFTRGNFIHMNRDSCQSHMNITSN